MNTTEKFRCYDHPRCVDRYTVVFTEPVNSVYTYLAMSEHPCHPQGFGQHGETKVPKSQWHNFGTLIPFSKLPVDCQRLVLQELEES